jgi:hypothetical protein
MRKFLQDTVTELSYYLEIILSAILAFALLFFSLSLIKDLSGFLSLESSDEVLLQRFLGKAMTLAVGVELIKMFSKSSPNTVIEVLLFALARQLVLDHANILDFLIGILAVAILFAVRKYLFTQFDATNNIIMRASQKVKIANVIARVNIQANKSETLRDFITRKLSEEDMTVAVGACVYLKNVALRIDKMHGDTITRVEIIKGFY